MKKIIYIITIAIMFLFIPYKVMAGQTTITSSGYYCSSNGFATSGGDYTCASGTIFPSGSGELCSYDQTQCNKNTSTPQCQNGYTYNSSTSQCTETTTQTSSPSCPSGYTETNGQCQQGNMSGSVWGTYANPEQELLYASGNCIDGNSVLVGSVCFNTSDNTFSGTIEFSNRYTKPSSATSTISGSGGGITGDGGSYGGSGYISYNASNNTFSGSISGGWFSNIAGDGNCLDFSGGGLVGQICMNLNTMAISCPSGYTYDSSTSQCTETTTQTTSPTCPSGMELVGDQCVSYSCPLGGSTQCIEPSGSSTYYCSPQSCYDLNYNNGTITVAGSNSNTQSMPAPQTNNGSVSNTGCSGSVSIFAGVAEQCRSGGIQTAYHDCCNAGTYLFGAIQCNSSEETVAKSLTYDQNYGNTVYPNANYTGGLEGEDIYVGSYCSDSFLGWCLERMDVFCQFPGLLAATIQQQGRAQIGLSWGSAHDPDCDGFTPNQLQELNFSSMNLSTLTNVLTQTAIAQAKTTLSNNLSSTTQSIKNEINQTMSGQ